MAFNQHLAKESEQINLETSIVTKGVEELLNDPGKGRYFLAEVDGKIVGQLMVTYEWSDWRNGMFWWIQSVYVHKNYRCRGVFKTLLQHVKSLSEQDNCCGLRLYVLENNLVAKSVYSGLNFQKTAYQLMEY